MKPSALIESLRNLNLTTIRQHPMLRDSISVAVLSIGVVLDIVTLVITVSKVHKTDYPVPVHYLSLIGFDQVGAWYTDYRLVVFATLVTIVNGTLAAQSFQRNRLVSFFLLLGAAAVSLLCLVVGLAFAVIV
jgi:hypothetical protein